MVKQLGLLARDLNFNPDREEKIYNGSCANTNRKQERLNDPSLSLNEIGLCAVKNSRTGHEFESRHGRREFSSLQFNTHFLPFPVA